MHVVTLSFDDGFTKSSLRQAEIFEKFGLSACLCVLATGHEASFQAPDKWHVGYPKADFGLWNELQARGHEVMPHGYKHANKAKMPLAEAQDLIRRCLDVFEKNLKGFDSRKAVFNFPYLATTPELEAWMPTVVRAFRGHGGPYNPLPTKATVRIASETSGEHDCEQDLDRRLDAFLKGPEGWFHYSAHGMDGEGWGPLSSAYLERLLARLVAMPGVKVLPAAKVLELVEES